jgi:hypothetical protein
VHVVDELESKQALQQRAPEDSLLVRMHHIVALANEQADGSKHHQDIERQLA